MANSAIKQSGKYSNWICWSKICKSKIYYAVQLFHCALFGKMYQY